MKIIFTLVITIYALTGCFMSGFAQATLILPVDITGVPGNQVIVPVNANGINNLVGFQFTIEYDTNKLTYTNTSNWASGITGVTISTPQEGKITFVYAEPNLKINIVDNKFFDICFTLKSGTAGSAYLNWSDNPTPRTLINYALEEISCNYVNGNVLVQSSCVAPSAPVAGAVTNSSVILNGLPSSGTWTITRTPGNITYSGSGTSYEVTQLNPGSYTFTVTNSSGCTSIASELVEIRTQSASLTLGTVNANPGSILTVSVFAKGIRNMVGFQFTIEYDKDKLNYLGCSNWVNGITGVIVSLPEDGKITFVYADPNIKINIEDGKFFDIDFNVINGYAGSVSLVWSDNPTVKTLINYDLEEINCTYESISTSLNRISEISFKIYPNPFSRFLNLDGHEKISRVRIAKINGEIVMDFLYSQYRINTEKLPDGFYVVTLISDVGVTKSELLIKDSK